MKHLIRTWTAILACALVSTCAYAGPGGNSRNVVCIDPGHPSEVNPGRAVQNGLMEVDINWRVARELAAQLKARGIRVVMTKHSRDEFVTNRKRAEIANGCRASIMLRLHCDTGGKSGFTVYYPNRQGRKSGCVGPSKSVIARSREAAKCIEAGLRSALKGDLDDDGIKGENSTAVGRKQGALTGSIFSKVPAVTVEMVFLSSRSDAKFIGSSAGIKKMAAALADGVIRWLGMTR